MTIKRNDYPRPQLRRNEWINLNGEWEFGIDSEKSGHEKNYFYKHFDKKIIVPFCPESSLSGIGITDFLNCVWYRKDFKLPDNYKNKKVILNFGAVDYHATVYLNGNYVGEHKGGYTPFSFDITKFINGNENYITVCVEDDVRSGKQPSGKQSRKLESAGCYYTRITGIWQTVWIEFVDEIYIENLKIHTDINTPCLSLEVGLSEPAYDNIICAETFFNGNPTGSTELISYGKINILNVKLTEKHLWDIGNGNLYDIKITVKKDGIIKDSIESYAGLRTVSLKDGSFLLNGKKFLGRFILDQGYYPDGLYTASDASLMKKDIEYAMKLGFNGARLHEKVFEPYYLYQADKLGFLVWGEYGNWGFDHSKPEYTHIYLKEWLEAVKRDFNHPSLIGWCPFNETSDFDKKYPQSDDLIRTIYEVTKEIDPTRPVIDTSGWYHVKTDIYDVHDYAQDAETLNETFSEIESGIIKDGIYRLYGVHRQHYNNEPVFLSEYGGIKWDTDEDSPSWGYGNAPKTEEEFIKRYKELTEYAIENERIAGFCYTQLYDIEQEKNGLMTYDRKFKFPPEIFYKINTKNSTNSSKQN